MNAEDKDMEITLPILQSIEERNDLTQRNLAERLGLALGVTNAYLKHCIHKGLVKIEQVPANRYLYYLTPKGLAEKSRLTVKYLSHSLTFYRHASDSCLQVFQQCVEKKYKQVVLCGMSDLTEIAILHATQMDIKILGIYDPKCRDALFMKYAVWKSFDEIPQEVVCVLTAVQSAQKMRKQLLNNRDAAYLLVPDILQF